MNAEVFTEWLRRQGHTVIRTASSYWHSQSMRVFQAFPYHWTIQPLEEETRELMLRNQLLALRYSMPAECAAGRLSYHAVYEGADYDFPTLSSWGRKNVRRGLRECSVSQISFQRYIDEGWELRVDTLLRQQRRVRESKREWQRQYATAADLPGFEVWAAEVGTRLAATVVIFRMESWYYMVYQQCHRDFLREHAPNALSFVVTQNLVRRRGTHGIFYGMQSLDAPASVDEFKFRMGYAARPVRQRVVFHPYAVPLVNKASYGLIKAAAGLNPGHYGLAKAEGMFRFFLSDDRGRELDSIGAHAKIAD